ncbi:retrovirus-related pol polyprotein from type-1 retrotransposable element r1 [Plakobranchus ocellatus]|uniref:Retrovirus-related pol polyprotein from type-1 retrotransposable element r1 n=1 Tax=Plakobranchus ocellatus TaxID=259542 RepID=A0AAV4B3G5_9GAST|nr:retrovirus-related pol polyprotein from type-1 retrotransposable element r1 [Plakobranchus ocellatus]
MVELKSNDQAKKLGAIATLQDTPVTVSPHKSLNSSKGDKHLQHLERTIQLCINNVQKWVSQNGFRFSVSKTTCVHFHRQRIYTEPALHLDGQPIPVKGEAKFLGVVFDSKLNFSSHVKYLKKKCLKALNLLRVVGHTDWGADRATLLKLYRTLVRSKLGYGSVIYGSAKKHVLRALDPIHHQGLRIALGAFRTSPIKSLYAEAGEPSLEHRRMKLAFNYVLKLKSLPRNPCHEVVFEAPLSDFSAVTKSEPNLVANTFEHFKNANISPRAHRN